MAESMTLQLGVAAMVCTLVLLADSAAMGQSPVDHPPTAQTPAVTPPAVAQPAEQLSDADAQAQITAIFEGLDANPPTVPESQQRRTFLRMLDTLCHYESATNSPPIRAAFNARIARALAEIAGTAPTGSRPAVTMLYNMGVIVRTPTVTIGFDLVRGPMHISDDVSRGFVSQCDVLFITHAHGDHASEWVRDEFLAQGKPVVAPLSAWPEDARLTRLDRHAQLRQKLAVQSGKRTLEVIVYPGHQGDLENNVYCVYTPEGSGIMQTGDQANHDDFAWIDRIKDGPDKVDVLICNCWSFNIARLVRGVNPRLVLPTHHLEMSHEPSHRETYEQTYGRYDGTNTSFDSREGDGYQGYPMSALAWGETISLPEP